MKGIIVNYIAYQRGVMYEDAPEEHHFCRLFILFEVNVLWLKSGFGSCAIGVLLRVELGTGIEA